MKKKHVVLLCVLAAVLLVGGGFAYVQRNTIGALIDSFRYSQEDVEKKMEENQKDLQKFIDEDDDISVRDLTDDEKKALDNGEITEDDVVSIITGQTTLEDVKKSENANTGQTDNVGKSETGGGTPNNPSKPEQPQPSAPTENGNTQTPSEENVLSELIAKLYVQKNQYLSKIDALDYQMRHEYSALPKEERKARKSEIISKYMKILGDWEKECDGVVYGILDEIKAELAKTGKDESLAKKIEEAYLNEKKLKKTAYMNEYIERNN